MAKKIDESKIVPVGDRRGPLFVIDEGKEGGYYGVWYKHPDGLWSHVCSGLGKENAVSIAGALNARTFFGGLNTHAKGLHLH